ncbi:MAG: peptide ABC transporter substrate-binding protein [Myxococcota bacterium]
MWASCLVIVVVASSCTKTKSAEPLQGQTATATAAGTSSAQKKRLILATNSEPDTLDPVFAEMAVSSEIRFLGQRELTMYNDKWELVPDLAEEVPSLQNGLVKTIEVVDANGEVGRQLQVTWRIRKDALWEDGVPVTGDDFVFAWQVTMDPTQEITERDLPERVAKMEVNGEDRKTLVVTWKAEYAFFDQYRVHHAYPAHLLRERYQRPDGTTVNLKNDRYGQRPLSNGPFQFLEWVPGQYITYVRNDRYHTPAQLDAVTVRFIPNNLALESALIAGDIDGILPMGGLTVPEVEDLRARKGDAFTYHSVPGLVWSHIDFNLDDEILRDVRVRRAIAHAIDRQGLIDQLYGGKYTLAHTFLPPRHWGYKADVAQIAYDPARTAALLDEAGWRRRSPEATRTNAQGQKLRLTINAVSGIKEIEQFQQVLQSELRQLGVELAIDNKPAKVFFGELARYRKLPQLSFYAWVMDPSSWGHTLWQSDMIPSEDNAWAGQNYPGWRNDEVTRLLEAIPAELDAARRRELLARVQDLYVEELPAIPMYFRPVVAVTRPAVQGFSPTGTQTPAAWNAHGWSLAAQ